MNSTGWARFTLRSKTDFKVKRQQIYTQLFLIVFTCYKHTFIHRQIVVSPLFFYGFFAQGKQFIQSTVTIQARIRGVWVSAVCSVVSRCAFWWRSQAFVAFLSVIWGCNPTSRSLSSLKSVKLQILLCIWKTHSLAHTYRNLYIRRVQSNIRPHTNSPQSLSLCSLPQPNCAADTSYLTTLPSSDTSPHKSARIAAQTLKK